MNNRTLVVPGGTGFLGQSVETYFTSRGWDVTILTRHPKRPNEQSWDAKTIGSWTRSLEGATAVLNLAGRSVNCRYNQSNRDEIETSRVDSTHVLGKAIGACKNSQRVWLNASTATIYRHAEDRAQDELTGEIGKGFSVSVAKAWEKAFFDTPTPKTRKIALRTAMVMGKGTGGPFEVFHRLVRFGLGGTMGPGTQYVSWVHDLDFCRAVEFLIERDDLDGAINVAAPDPMPNRDFMRAIRDAAQMPIGLPASVWMMHVGAFFLRTETELPLKSRWVLSTRLQQSGFDFTFKTWKSAAEDLTRSTPSI